MDFAPIAVLAEHFGIEEATIVGRATRGHTNESYALATPRGALVLRRAWAGKPLDRVACEERVLSWLARKPPDATIPRVVPTIEGTVHAIVGDRVVHLFARCDGDPGPHYLPGRPDAGSRVRAAADTLARLHRALAAIPTDAPSAWQWLAERRTRISGLRGSSASLPGAVGAGLDRVLDRIDQLVATTTIDGPRQWLHGDYHLGNLLWQDTTVTGVVDFDDTGMGARAGELAMALYALSRRDAGEGRFEVDRTLWRAGLAAYAEVAGTDHGLAPDDRLELVFCAYQVMIHLEAALRGLWDLEPGIGFWPCWHRLAGIER